MRKLSLTIIGVFIQLFSAFAQTDSTANCYKARKLHLDEVNFVSAYYNQDGNNSAVTGGIGSEKLTDFANTIELRLIKQDSKLRQHNLSLELGIDHYTSASSDKIDPNTISSASSKDTRIYPTLSWSVKNDPKGLMLGANASFSTEFDYKSRGLGASVAKSSKDNNTEVGLRLQAYWDTWTIIYPIELRPPGKFSGHGGSDEQRPRDSYSGSLSVSHVVNKRLQVALLADGVYQTGELATLYQRVYFNNGAERVENLPGNRTKIPIGVRASYFAGDKFILRGFYRYYTDDWGIQAHTASLEVPIKLGANCSISPFYRYYTQTAADYFAPYQVHSVSEEFYTSDYDLSAFSSQFYGAEIRFVPEKEVFHLQHWNSLELRYGHYTRSNGLHSDIVTLYAKFK
jgi:hypothetical protein